MSKTTHRRYDPKFKMRVALEVTRGEKTLSQVASENGIAPSLAAAWRDELLGSAEDVFGKTQQDRERREREEAARKRYDEAPGTIGQLKRARLPPAVLRRVRLRPGTGGGPRRETGLTA